MRVHASLLALSFVLLAASDAGALEIKTLSARADMVSGGDVLVRIAGSTGQRVAVTLNDKDVTSAFKPGAEPNTWLGLVSGLSPGANRLSAKAQDAKEAVEEASVTLTNYPITGPVISGPHEQPFICMTQNFPLPANADAKLGAATDANCSIATRVDYVYRTRENAFKPLPSGERPADLATTTTSTGKAVPYIVRVETGTINRGIYQTAMLHDPSEPAPTPFAPPSSWNKRLVYTFGGGCPGGWYIQGTSIGNGGILEDLMLRQGYGLASSTLNVFGNNCNDVIAAETVMMVRERFIETFGAPAFTIGYGCSAGAEQEQPIADNYPGLLDGIVVGCSFLEPISSLTFPNVDAGLVLNYLEKTKTLPWSEEEIIAATGLPNSALLRRMSSGIGALIKVQGGNCNAIVPANTRFDKDTNPKGVRCGLYDHFANVLGRNESGAARRTFDNTGVQYGLDALIAGKISKAQFIDLNRNIGGHDNDGINTAARSVGDAEAIKAAYRTGRVTTTGLGMKVTPIIDYRAYVDKATSGLESHQRMQSFLTRARLVAANGHFDNQVMVIENDKYGLFNDASPVLSHTLTQMDQWLTKLLADTSSAPMRDKINRAKPADLVEACFKPDGSKIAETQVFAGDTACNALYPAHGAPRQVAGGPLANDVLKCQLKPLAAADYKGVTFAADELAELGKIFPAGVCDWSKPGVDQAAPAKTWISFGPAPG